jgi:RNA polymerase subunit RPABC4/transcription elongation factor Spt4
MKYLCTLVLAFLLISCSSTQLVEQWKNPDIKTYAPAKVLVVGLTSNMVARQKFEDKLKEQLEMRGAEVHTSIAYFKPTFKTEKLTEEELLRLEQDLINDGFDTVLFSKVFGVEDKIAYTKNFDVYDETFVRFKEDYLRYQDIFYNPDYYEEYTIYHAETSMYCICPTKDRELLWKGYVDIVDPQSIESSVSDYVELIIAVLEEQQLVNVKALEPVVDELD